MQTLRRLLLFFVLLFAVQLLIGNVCHERIHHAASHAADGDRDCPVCQIGMLPTRHLDPPDLTPYLLLCLHFAPLPYRTRKILSRSVLPITPFVPRGPPTVCCFS